MNAPHRMVDASQLEYLYQTNFARKLEELGETLRRRLMNKLIERGHPNLKMSFSAVLTHLAFAETRLVDIAEQAGMSKQAIGQIADEIETLGYIRRIPDPNDRRAKNLVFTAKGEHLIDQSIQALKEIEQELVKEIGTQEFEQFKHLLNRLSESL